MRLATASMVTASLLTLAAVALGQEPAPSSAAPAAQPQAVAPPPAALPPPPPAPPPGANSTAAPTAPYVGAPPYYGPTYAPAQPQAGWGPPPARKRRSTGMMIAGIAMAGLGGLAVVAGSVEYVAASGLCNPLASRSFSADSCVHLYQVLGVSEMIVGGVLVAVGLPLAVVGAGKPPPDPAASLPTLRLGRSGASLAWAF